MGWELFAYEVTWKNPQGKGCIIWYKISHPESNQL